MNFCENQIQLGIAIFQMSVGVGKIFESWYSLDFVRLDTSVYNCQYFRKIFRAAKPPKAKTINLQRMFDLDRVMVNMQE